MLIKGKTVLWWFNVLIMQWFCVRLCKKYRKLPKGLKYVGLSFMYWVKPMTGFKTHYKLFGKNKVPKYTRLFWS